MTAILCLIGPTSRQLDRWRLPWADHMASNDGAGFGYGERHICGPQPRPACRHFKPALLGEYISWNPSMEHDNLIL